MSRSLMGLTDGRRCVPIDGETPESELVIQGSVGKGGRTIPADVRKIQEAPNRVPPEQGGPQPPLVVNGLIGPKTVGAITRFQQHHFGAAKADGRVDTNQYTIAKLREFQPDHAWPGVNGISLGIVPGGLFHIRPVMDRVRLAHPEGAVVGRFVRQRLRWAKQQLTGEPTELHHDALMLVHRCFKVLELPDAAAQVRAIRRIQAVFVKMNEALELSRKTASLSGPWAAGNEPTRGKINVFMILAATTTRPRRLAAHEQPRVQGPLRVAERDLHVPVQHRQEVQGRPRGPDDPRAGSLLRAGCGTCT